MFGTRSGEYRTLRELTLLAAIGRLDDEAFTSRLGAVTLSTNIPIRRDGQPFTRFQRPDDPGAAIRFVLDGTAERCLACDKWLRVEDNVAAIAAHVKALRQIERWGVGSREQAFAGYAALPAPGETQGRTGGPCSACR